jgi:hypothetical protein
MTKADFDSIAVNGLINHIHQVGMPSNTDYLKTLQKCCKGFAKHKNVRGLWYFLSLTLMF